MILLEWLCCVFCGFGFGFSRVLYIFCVLFGNEYMWLVLVHMVLSRVLSLKRVHPSFVCFFGGLFMPLPLL